MKLFMILVFQFLVNTSIATEIKILNFNTMCDVCKGSSYFGFNKRLAEIRKLIIKHKPDLISLQEIRTASQVESLFGGLPQYKYLTTENFLFSFADPTIAFNSNKFKKITNGNLWLGPKSDGFNLGWKLSLPRQLHWVKLSFGSKELIFAGSHFDNRIENLNGSAELLNHFFKSQTTPTILAADTNMTIDMPEYQKLVNGVFLNSFDLKNSFEVSGQYKTDKEICYTRKGKVFPECRVDHILLSKQHKWGVKKFIIDTTKDESGAFLSDHRPVITIINLVD